MAERDANGGDVDALTGHRNGEFGAARVGDIAVELMDDRRVAIGLEAARQVVAGLALLFAAGNLLTELAKVGDRALQLFGGNEFARCRIKVCHAGYLTFQPTIARVTAALALSMASSAALRPLSKVANAKPMPSLS